MCESLQRWEPTLAQKVDSSGRTALHYAASSGKTGVVKLLLVNSLLAYIPDDDGLYPVHYAAIAGYSEIIREIMEICPSCDELVDKKHRSILHCAVEFVRVKVVWYICRNPKFISIMDAGDSEGNTPLHLAVKHGHVLSFFLLMMDIRVNLGIIGHITAVDVALNENTHKYSFSAFMDIYVELSLFLCEAYYIPSNLARNLRHNHCLEHDKKSRRFSDVSQSMLCLSVLIAAGSFAAAFSPPGNYITKGGNAGMAPFDGKSYFLSYVAANSLSFYYSAIGTCLLVHASLATTPIRYRSNYLRLSSAMVLGAFASMFAAFTNVVRLALDPQKSWREFLMFYFTVIVQNVSSFCMFWSWSLLAIPIFLWVSRRSIHGVLNMHFNVRAALARCVIYYYMAHFILYVISFIKKSVQPGNRESCNSLGCHDAVLLHPT